MHKTLWKKKRALFFQLNEVPFEGDHDKTQVAALDLLGLLEIYSNLFVERKGFPPGRIQDNRIPMKLGAGPINLNYTIILITKKMIIEPSMMSLLKINFQYL